jgi:hypothetical protein
MVELFGEELFEEELSGVKLPAEELWRKEFSAVSFIPQLEHRSAHKLGTLKKLCV